LVRKNVEGIGFALSFGDLLNLLKRFNPDLAPPDKNRFRTTAGQNVKLAYPADSTAPLDAPAGSANSVTAPSLSERDDFGTRTSTSDMPIAKIHVDAQFRGNPPASLRLAAGAHKILVTCVGRPDYAGMIEV
jgi:hypothetical protein